VTCSPNYERIVGEMLHNLELAERVIPTFLPSLQRGSQKVLESRK
jgi:hypothetical protein